MNLKTRMSALALGAITFISSATALATLLDYQNAVILEPSIISYYTFDQTNVNDTVGSNNGSAQGTAKFSAGVGGSGVGLLLDGAGRATLGRVPAFDFSAGTGSVEAWVRADWPGTLSAYAPCIFANRDGGPVTWSVHMTGNRAAVGLWNGDSFQTRSIPNPGTTWYHLAVVFDNSPGYGTVTFYWDGTPVGTTTQDLGASPETTQLGSSSAAFTDEGWVGMLDEVAFYGAALSADAILAHYRAFFAGTPPVIVVQPRGGTFLPGVLLQLTVGATGPNLAYQWYKDSAPLSGATNATLAITNLAAGDAGTYHVVVSNPATSVTSSDATVALASPLPAALTSYQAAVTAESGLLSYYTFDQLTVQDTVGPNDGTLAGTAGFGQGIGGVPAQGLLLDGGGFADLGGVPDFQFSSGTGSVEAWVRADWAGVAGYNPCLFADRNSGPVRWSVHMNGDKQAVGMWNGLQYLTLPMPSAGTNWHHLAVAFDTGNMTIFWDSVPLGTLAQPFGSDTSTIQLGSSATPGAAEGWMGMLDEVAFYSTALSAASVQAHYAAFEGATPPVITVQPVGGAFYPGQPLVLAVWATGANLAYQWYKDGSPLTGATNWALVFANLAASDAGTYYASVSNPGGTTNSVSAIVQAGSYLSRYQQAVLGEASLISYYTFDASDASDAKGLNPGSPAGNVTLATGIGQGADMCLLLDGTGSIDLGQVAAFDFANGNGTVEGWIRVDWTTVPGYDPCVFAERNGGPTDWSIHMSRWRNSIGCWNGSHFQALGLGNTSGWHHYAVAFGNGGVTMFWDGVSLGTFGQAIALTTGLTTQIGSSSASSTAEGWIGGLDEVAFYLATLGPDTIRSHFLAMVTAPPPPSITWSRAGNQLTLSWPVDVSGFTLESTDKLPATAWTPVPGVLNNQVTVTLSTENRFYRLRK
jgi:hypothetical protein